MLSMEQEALLHILHDIHEIMKRLDIMRKDFLDLDNCLWRVN